jgi:hypothetical protein
VLEESSHQREPVRSSKEGEEKGINEIKDSRILSIIGMKTYFSRFNADDGIPSWTPSCARGEVKVAKTSKE